MKNWLLIVAFCGLAQLVTAQNTSGVVTYEMTMDVHSMLPPAAQAYKEMIPKTRKSAAQLTFTEEESMYKNIKRELTPEEKAEREKRQAERANRGRGGGRRGMRGGMGGRQKREIYRNIEEEEVLESQEFMGRQFLIKGDEEGLKWKMSTEVEEIQGFNCMSATTTRPRKEMGGGKIDTITVWFTADIPVSTGPETLAGLPGLILKVDMNQGQIVTVATKVELKELEEEDAIKKPTEGKEVTREKYQEIVKEKMEEMRQEMGGRGGRFMFRG